MKNNYIKKISDYTIVGGLGALLLTSFSGCGQKPNENLDTHSSFNKANIKEGALVIIQKQPNGGYAIIDEFPSDSTRIILREIDGSERILSKQEIDKLVKDESVKIDNGTSNLTNPQESVSSGGMGLGEVLLSSIAGAMIGSYIGNKLFNNNNYKNNRSRSYRSPSTYSRSTNSFNRSNKNSSTRKSSSNKKSGYFRNSGGSKSNSRSRSFFGG
jgi:hypothetical protein